MAIPILVEMGADVSADVVRQVEYSFSQVSQLLLKKKPHINCGVALFAHQYSSANMIVSTQLTARRSKRMTRILSRSNLSEF
jgi:hypothetical protein